MLINALNLGSKRSLLLRKSTDGLCFGVTAAARASATGRNDH
jgi:hypothetical protein